MTNGKQTVAVIDYGMGNLHSVASALSHVAPDQNVVVTSDPAVVAAADRVVFPGVGWNQVHHNEHPLWANIPQDSRFYFVHSFYILADDASQIAATCDYGLPFHAALAQGNLFAVQFHPEKSHTAGLQLLKNFLHWDGKA